MLFGIISVLTGLVLCATYSSLVGGFFLVVGVAVIGRQYTQGEKPPTEYRAYQSTVPTYDLSSKPRPRR